MIMTNYFTNVNGRSKITFLIFLSFSLSLMCLFAKNSNAEVIEVAMQDFMFVPMNITVNVGDTVRWTNQGMSSHTSTSGASCNSDGKWDSGLLSTGESYEYVFKESGTYFYYCKSHCSMGMMGTIMVNNGTMMDCCNCSLMLNQNGIVSLSIKNECGEDMPHEIKIWTELSGRKTSIINIGSDGSIVIPTGFQAVIPLFPSSIIPNNATLGVRFLDPITGETQCLSNLEF